MPPRAASWRTDGSESFALVDSRGRVYGWAPRRAYVSASVTKAMMLVAYLREIGRRAPTASERALLDPMIQARDNDRADSVYAHVGDAGLLRVAGRAHMRHFRTAGYWASASITAIDQARFFLRIDRLVPRRNRAYARHLLSSIVPAQRWGSALRAEGRLPDLLQGRLARHRDREPGARGGALRAARRPLRDGGAHRRQPEPRVRHGTLRGVALARLRPATRSRAAAGRPALRRAGLGTCCAQAPGIRVDLAYGGPANLTGRRLPGYCEPWAYLLRPAARDLAAVQRDLRRHGHGLLVRDAYRPARASRALVRWALRSGRPELVGTYIARRSRHNTGSAVDLTLVRHGDGRRLRMGTGYDHLAHVRTPTRRAGACFATASS